MKNRMLICVLLIFSACIPIRIAPKIKDHKLMVAKKFKRSLPRETAYIFSDPKDANEFYNYINTKFKLQDLDVGYNSPVKIGDKTYYLTYHETEIPNKTLNLPLIVADAALEKEGYPSLFVNNHVRRKGNWYLVLTIYDEDIRNCLLKKHPDHQKVLAYLNEMKTEYLRTSNYMETLFETK